MGIPTTEQHSVWTYNDAPEWLEKNCGIPDMVLTNGEAHDRAAWSASRLAEAFPHATFEVRNIYGTVTDTFGAAREETARPVPASHRGRRTLGGRGR